MKLKKDKKSFRLAKKYLTFVNKYKGISNNLDRAPLKTKKFEAVEVLKTAV